MSSKGDATRWPIASTAAALAAAAFLDGGSGGVTRAAGTSRDDAGGT
jgi:hypothetical protein